MKPTPHKPTWMVYTTGELASSLSSDQPSWAWTAQGSRGFDGGIERSAEDARQKAAAAALLLDEPSRQRAAA